MSRSLFIILLSSALFDQSGAGCSACDKGGGGSSSNSDFSIPQAQADAVLAADSAQSAAWAAVESEFKAQPGDSDQAMRRALLTGTQVFLHGHTFILATSRGSNSDEQKLSVLLTAARTLISDASELAPAASLALSAKLDVYIEKTQALADALSTAATSADLRTAAHEAAHVVQQHSGVRLRTAQIVPTRGWLAAGVAAHASAHCKESIAVLQDMATGEMLTTPDLNLEAAVAPTSSVRSLAWLVTPLGATGSCSFSLSANTDLRSAPARWPRGNPSVDAFTAAASELNTANDNLMASKTFGLLLGRIAALSQATAAELLMNITAESAFPLSDVRLAAEARGAWVSELLAVTLSSGIVPLDAQANTLTNVQKSKHDAAMAAIQNLR